MKLSDNGPQGEKTAARGFFISSLPGGYKRGFSSIHPMNSMRWNIVVSSNTDRSVRMHLAGEGRGRKGGLSRFVEEAVRARIFDLTAERVKAANAGVSEEDLSAIVAEALGWQRALPQRRSVGLNAPTEETREAIVELESGKGQQSTSVDALMTDLNKDQ